MSSHSSSLSLKSAMDRSVPEQRAVAQRTRDKFRRFFSSPDARGHRLDSRRRGRAYRFESWTTKGRTLINDRRLADEGSPDRLFRGPNIPRLQRRNDASVPKRRPHSTAERFYFIGLKGVKYRRQGPIYLHTDARVSGNHPPVPSSSPFLSGLISTCE